MHILDPNLLERAAVETIRDVAVRELGVTRDVQPTDDLAVDVGLDSLSLMTLVVALEDRFRVILTNEDQARTVGDLARLVASRATPDAEP